MRVAAIVTSNPDRRREAKSEHPEARLLDTPEQLFANRDAIDLVVISTPNRTHVPLALQAVDAKLPVVVDKPSLMYLDNVTVDFHDDLNRRGFSISNPSAKSTCGCGSSFSM